MFWKIIAAFAPVLYILPFLESQFPNLYSWNTGIIIFIGVVFFIFALVGLRRLLSNMKVVVCEENIIEASNFQKKDDTDMSYNQTVKSTVLESQYADAKMRMENQDYWGDTGYWVTLAIQHIELAIDSVPFGSDTNQSEWIKQVIKKVKVAHQNYRENEDDPDGYGSATFHEVLRSLQSI